MHAGCRCRRRRRVGALCGSHFSSPARIFVRSVCAYIPACSCEAACIDIPAGWRPAEALSPSQVTQFLNCPAKWYFRYFLDLEEPPTGATAFGKAFHETIAHNFVKRSKPAWTWPPLIASNISASRWDDTWRPPPSQKTLCQSS